MEKQNFRRLGTMLDCSRDAVLTVESVKKWIDLTADLGYNTVMLYTEDTYEVNNQPYFGYLRGRYTKEELREMDAYAASKNMEMIPCIQTLAHLKELFRWPAYFDIQDIDDILLVGNEKTYRLIDDMFATLAECFRGRIVNIGMDEAHHLGRGQYEDINGAEPRADILIKHLKKVAEIAAKYGFELIMWGDMLFRIFGGGNYYQSSDIPQQVKDTIPENVNLIYWDYYSTEKSHYDKLIKAHSAVKSDIWFAGGLWDWNTFTPMNGYSVETATAAITACRENGVQDVFFTMWGDDGAECSDFAQLPSLYYVSRLAYGETDEKKIKAEFEKKFGIPFDDYLAMDPVGEDKHMLYNDYFLGVFDAEEIPQHPEEYQKRADVLKKYVSRELDGQAFNMAYTLFEVLASKATIGKRTRDAYKANDRKVLENLVTEYGDLVGKIETFHKAFREQWMKENKPHGFQVHDIRIGGLLLRTKSCQDRLKDYLSGKIDSIPELEETLLPIKDNRLWMWCQYTMQY